VTPLNVHAFGPQDGRPVLAIHGITGHGGRFRRLAGEGLTGWRVLAVDLRGHGQSTWAPPWSAEQHVRDLADTLDAHGLERVPVVGHSYGGMLAAELAGRRPERVERIVLLDPAIALDAQKATELSEEAREELTYDSLEALQAARAADRTPEAAEAARADAVEHGVQGEDGRWRLNYLVSTEVTAYGEMAAPVPDVRVPTLLVTALQADLVTDRVRDGLRASAGAGFREERLDCGHMVYWDRFDDVAALVRGFLEG
jgi:lipase